MALGSLQVHLLLSELVLLLMLLVFKSGRREGARVGLRVHGPVSIARVGIL